MNIVTWNMQGSNASTENKWNTGVLPLIKSMDDPTSVICLQECGGVPKSTRPFDKIPINLGAEVMDFVEVYMWGWTDTTVGYTALKNHKQY